MSTKVIDVLRHDWVPDILRHDWVPGVLRHDWVPDVLKHEWVLEVLERQYVRMDNLGMTGHAIWVQVPDLMYLRGLGIPECGVMHYGLM